jgi:hypothetical protein
MSPPHFDSCVDRATSIPGETRQPYDYQRRPACRERDGRSETAWFTSGAACKSQLIDSTYASKTDQRTYDFR